MTTPRDWLERIRGLPLPQRVRIMNVCGGHERSITMAGLRGALPPQIEMIPGPGCPVCVCPEEDIYAAIQLARRGVVVAALLVGLVKGVMIAIGYSAASTAAIYLLMLIVLLVRPRGLFGERITRFE